MTSATPPLDELYRELILEHYRSPRRRGHLEQPSGRFEGMNPVCGDEVSLELRVDGGRLSEVAFSGLGCSISQASASMLAESVSNRDALEVRELIAAVRAMLQGGEADASLGDLEALSGVAKFPVRVKCALLSWNVLEQGLDELIPAAA
jgi:nitrogen fixation NifU-like protein